MDGVGLAPVEAEAVELGESPVRVEYSDGGDDVVELELEAKAEGEDAQGEVAAGGVEEAPAVGGEESAA